MNSVGILVDLKKNRICIHSSTMQALGHPQNVQLLVNPQEKIFVLAASEKLPSTLAVRNTGKESHIHYEIYSRKFTQQLSALRPDLLEISSFRLAGQPVPGGTAVVFNLATAVPTAVKEGLS